MPEAAATPTAGDAMALPVFERVTVHATPLADGIAREAGWMADAAATGRAAAHLWSAPEGLVVPRSYERLPLFDAACRAAAAEGWPVQVRVSGGGIVPQGPGVLDLSLVWRSDSAAPARTDAIYRALCDRLAAAFAGMGIAAAPQEVPGSFCDGRFNLAVGGRKLVGTAQSWRRVGSVPAVLVHAVILAGGDTERLTERANAFEAAAGSARRYRADALTSVEKSWCDAHGHPSPPADLPTRLLAALTGQFARRTRTPAAREADPWICWQP